MYLILKIEKTFEDGEQITKQFVIQLNFVPRS